MVLSAVVSASVLAAPPGAARLESGRFTVIHYPADRTMASAALADAVARDSFPWLPRGAARVLIMIAPDAATFSEWAGPSAGQSTAAVAFAEQRRVVMRGRRASQSHDDPLRVLRHELAHVALYEYLNLHADRWFDEGYASYAAGEDRSDGLVATNIALMLRRMPSLPALDSMLTSSRPAVARGGYALALRAVTDLAALDRQRGLAPLLEAWKERRSFDLALRRASAMTTEAFERDWQRRTRWGVALPALAADSTLVLALMLLPLVPVYRSRRRAQRARLEAMRAAEARSERASASNALDRLLEAIPAAPQPVDPHA